MAEAVFALLAVGAAFFVFAAFNWWRSTRTFSDARQLLDEAGAHADGLRPRVERLHRVVERAPHLCKAWQIRMRIAEDAGDHAGVRRALRAVRRIAVVQHRAMAELKRHPDLGCGIVKRGN